MDQVQDRVEGFVTSLLETRAAWGAAQGVQKAHIMVDDWEDRFVLRVPGDWAETHPGEHPEKRCHGISALTTPIIL